MNLKDLKRTFKNLRGCDLDTGTFLFNLINLIVAVIAVLSLIAYWVFK